MHNALLTTDRAYSNEAGFQKTQSLEAADFWASILNFLGKIPVLGILFPLTAGKQRHHQQPRQLRGLRDEGVKVSQLKRRE